jgi:uncharacterized protein
MEQELLTYNLTNPTILFFMLGMLAVCLKSDLEVPASSSKFISLYLLFSIGFKGGQELSHTPFTGEIFMSIIFGILIALLIPIYVFFLLRRKFNIYDSAAVAASYGSVSAVTFVAAISFLEIQQLSSGGHMVAVMALMEAPAIVMGVMLMRFYDRSSGTDNRMGNILHHALTNGSVLLIVGSLLIGYISDTRQAEGIKPFTTDIFKGFLSIFLLEMGMVTARRLRLFLAYGPMVLLYGLLIPLVNGSVVALLSSFVTQDTGDRFIFAILAASASYIAVPAAMRKAIPQSDPGLYIAMSLGLTFPVNITLGMPWYFYLVQG